MTKAYTSPENGGNTYHSRDKRKKRIPSVSRLRRGDKFLIVLILLAIAGKLFLGSDIIGNAGPDYLKKVTVPDWIDIQLIDTDGASRRGTDLKNFNDIVVHYVANPGSTAQQNRDYFNSPDSSVSAHTSSSDLKEKSFSASLSGRSLPPVISAIQTRFPSKSAIRTVQGSSLTLHVNLSSGSVPGSAVSEIWTVTTSYDTTMSPENSARSITSSTKTSGNS